MSVKKRQDGGVSAFTSDIDRRTVKEMVAWLALDPDAAWPALYASAHRAARALARRWRLQPADVEDVADVVLVRVVVDEFASLRRPDASTVLEAWLRGVARNVLRERRLVEARFPRRSLDEADAQTSPGEPDAEPSRPRRRRVSLHHLPPAQRAVMALVIRGVPERRIAALLGVTRHHVHDVRRRALARLRSGKQWVALRDPADRSWAVAAARRAKTAGDPLTSLLLEMYAAGATRAAISGDTGLTTAAVKERVHRRRPTP